MLLKALVSLHHDSECGKTRRANKIKRKQIIYWGGKILSDQMAGFLFPCFALFCLISIMPIPP